MKIAVFGSGGVGGYFGARLAKAGADVHFIARGRHLEAIRANGLKIESALGDVVLKPADATDDPAAIGPVDLAVEVISANTRTYDFETKVPAYREGRVGEIWLIDAERRQFVVHAWTGEGYLSRVLATGVVPRGLMETVDDGLRWFLGLG